MVGQELVTMTGHKRNIDSFISNFIRFNNNQTYQDGKPACSKLVLHVTITLREKDIFSNSISLATTTLSWILDEHVFSFTRM